jgi:hypothetical protein
LKRMLSPTLTRSDAPRATPTQNAV